MKVLIVIILYACSGCLTYHRFQDRRTRIIPSHKISSDSITVNYSRIFGYRELSAFGFYEVSLLSRPDSIRGKLERSLKDLLPQKTHFIAITPKCQDALPDFIRNSSPLNTGSWQNRIFKVDSISVVGCIDSLSQEKKLHFVVRMSVGEEGNSSSATWDYISCSILLTKGRSIILYRNYESRFKSDKKYFPKDSWDRRNFPHFPNWQIDRMVNTVVDDLKKYIH